MEARRVLEEIHRQIGAVRQETQWFDGAFAWRPRRLWHRVEVRTVAKRGGARQIASTIYVTERVRALPERVQAVLDLLRSDSGDGVVYAFDAAARSLCSRMELVVTTAGEKQIEKLAGLLLRQIADAERQAPRFASVLAGRIPIIREPAVRGRRRRPPTDSSDCGAVER